MQITSTKDDGNWSYVLTRLRILRQVRASGVLVAKSHADNILYSSDLINLARSRVPCNHDGVATMVLIFKELEKMGAKAESIEHCYIVYTVDKFRWDSCKTPCAFGILRSQFNAPIFVFIETYLLDCIYFKVTVK
jgi:hypothetical protein